MPISAERITADITAVAQCSECPPDQGYSRPTFTEPWRQARDYIIQQALEAGCQVRTDPAGNVHARPTSIPWSERVWLAGSHIDSVPTGGKFDGVAGIVCPLEVLRSAHETGRAVPLELIIFAEEEGSTFGLGMIGSRLWCGDVQAATVRQFKNAQGQHFFEAGAHLGVIADQAVQNAPNDSQYLGVIEIHIEQGPGLWKRDQRLAVVQAIAGRRQYRVVVRGEANHAGATSMTDRRDALVTAAAIIQAMPAVAADLSPAAVITVGRLNVFPNAINIIPERVELTIDFRDPSDEILRIGDAEIQDQISKAAVHTGTTVGLNMTENLPACPLDATLCGHLLQTAKQLDIDMTTTVSGALHDAAIVARCLPTAMLFVPSKDGISHNPAEFSRVEDLAQAARLLQALVLSD